MRRAWAVGPMGALLVVPFLLVGRGSIGSLQAYQMPGTPKYATISLLRSGGNGQFTSRVGRIGSPVLKLTSTNSKMTSNGFRSLEGDGAS
jgi:hypothetical protein